MLETKSAPFTFVKQGIFYFSRRVPSDLSHHFGRDGIGAQVLSGRVSTAPSWTGPTVRR